MLSDVSPDAATCPFGIEIKLDVGSASLITSRCCLLVMKQDSSDCLSQNEISRLAAGSASANDSKVLGAHVDLCDRCRDAVNQFLTETSGLENRLSKLTLRDLDKAGEALAKEVSVGSNDLESWLGDQANQLAEQTALFSTPCRLGQYELHGLIAPGGMGEVYRATHSRLKREVAVKVIRRNQQESQVFYENFLREIETLGQLDHPNMVRAFDALEFDGYLFLVMELLDGDSLKSLANQGKAFTLVDALKVMLGLARAVGHLHDNGYLHLDIKPSNVMVLGDGRTKLIDYGLAMPSEDTSRPGVKVFRGTAGYMPPEQLQLGKVGSGTDLYGTGKVFEFLIENCLGAQSGKKSHALLQSLSDLIQQMTASDQDQRLHDPSVVIHQLEALIRSLDRSSSFIPAIRSRVGGLAIVGGLLLLVLVAVLRLGVLGTSSDRVAIEAAKADADPEWMVVLSRSDITNTIGMPMNVVPDGAMTNETLVKIQKELTNVPNQIYLPQPLYMGMCEVTQEQYAEVMGEHTNSYPGEMHPAETVTIEDAMEFCRRLSDLPGEKEAGRVYRLPTSDEWEYACRANASSEYAFSDKVWQMDAHGWYNGNSGAPQHIATKRSNGWGFFDMHGNVSELVVLSDDDFEAISKATGSECWWGHKGGSWAVTADEAKCSQIAIPADPSKFKAGGGIGFRVVCNLLPEQGNEQGERVEVNRQNELYTISIDLRGKPDPAPVHLSNAIIFRESESVHYWTTEEMGKWAEIEYQFELPAPIESVEAFEHLAWVYNDNHFPSFDPYCQGTVEVCGDDKQWHVIFHSESDLPIVDNRITALPLLRGSTTVGLRARLYSGRRGKYVYYSQFLRRGDHDVPHQLKFRLRSAEKLAAD